MTPEHHDIRGQVRVGGAGAKRQNGLRKCTEEHKETDQIKT